MDPLTSLPAEFAAIQRQLARLVVGHEDTTEKLLIALLAEGHCLFESPPGVGRALLAHTFAATVGLAFARVHVNQELEPEHLLCADSNAATASGDPLVTPPLEAGIVFFDDGARLRPRMEGALQQMLQDGSVEIGGRCRQLPQPHLVLAATYKADDLAEEPFEPRVDRFMLKLSMRYPSYENEYQLAELCSGPPEPAASPVWDADRILALRQAVRHVAAPPSVIHYALRLVRATRVHEGVTPDFVYQWVRFGAGPRASHFLTLAAKVRAALHGRSSAEAADVQAVAHPVLRHRILTNDNARSTGVTVERVIDRLIDEVPEREEGGERSVEDEC